MGTSRGDQYTLFIISRLVLLRLKNVSDKRCRENRNTRFMFNNFSRKPCCLRDNVEKYEYCTVGQTMHCMLYT